MSRKITTYEVILKDADGAIRDRYDNQQKTPVKRVFNQLYTQHKFGGVTGQHERSTLALQQGTVYTNPDGWTLQMTTTHDRSYI